MGGVRAVITVWRPLITWALALCAATAMACGASSAGQDLGERDPELELRVERLLPRIEELAHLEARETPVIRRSSAATLEAYLIERLEVEYPGDTLENVAAAYQAFGLLSDTLDLRQLLIDLMLEQAVGYYDPGRNVLFVREGASDPLLDAVIVHELVHAVQDQHVNLDSLIQSTTSNDARTAFQAAMEGHATAAMMVYQMSQLSGTSVTLEELPELGPELTDLAAGASQFPRLAAAPPIVREPLLFAYLGGVRFVQRLWRTRHDNPPPIGPWLPRSTEQLIHTERLLESRDAPVRLSVDAPTGGWTVLYAQDLGELETRIYFQEHLGDKSMAVRAAAGWDGDAYALLARGRERALVWYTVWDSEADADEFMTAYRRAFQARFGVTGLTTTTLSADLDRLTVADMPTVRVVERSAGAELEPPGITLTSQ